MKPGNKFMKRLSLYLFLLLFTLQAPSWADDIRDVQIEGISIGDSLLDFFNKKEIKDGMQDWYKNKKYTTALFNKKLETYDKLYVSFLTDDKQYKVKSVSASIEYRSNIEECYEKAKTIYLEIKEALPELKDYGKYVYKHNDDPEGTVTDYALLNDKEDEVFIGCYDYSKSYESTDHLRVGVRLIEFVNFLIDDAY